MKKNKIALLLCLLVMLSACSTSKNNDNEAFNKKINDYDKIIHNNKLDYKIELSNNDPEEKVYELSFTDLSNNKCNFVFNFLDNKLLSSQVTSEKSLNKKACSQTIINILYKNKDISDKQYQDYQEMLSRSKKVMLSNDLLLGYDNNDFIILLSDGLLKNCAKLLDDSKSFFNFIENCQPSGNGSKLGGLSIDGF
ncbi:MAG: hypothetical protein LBT75_01390 [Bacilli bacterium]|jgi:hypothetical protein|nr:hypothetical protein [Bacilli bacterium]